MKTQNIEYNQANFLKTFGIGTVGFIIPNTLLTQKAIKVYENYVKGTSYYKIDKLQNNLNVGDELRLERESKNKYDSFAISVGVKYITMVVVNCFSSYFN